MNYRQKKKAFKKKYGCNPNQFANQLIDNIIPYINSVIEMLPSAIEEMMKACSEYCNCIIESTDELINFLHREDIKEIVERLAKEAEDKEGDEK